MILGPTKYVHVIPDLAQHSPTSIRAIRGLSSSSVIVSRSRAAHVRHSAMLGRKSVLELDSAVSSAVARRNVMLCKPLPCRELLIVSNRSLEEIYHLFMLLVLGSIAWYIECRKACGVLAELVSPKISIWTCLGDPVLVHPGEKIVFAEWLKESADIATVVRWNHCAIGQAIRGVW